VKRKLLTGAAIAGVAVVALASPAAAQDVPEGVAPQVVLDNLWVFIAGALVFFMQAGFGLVEAGLTRAKNVANIMMKNLMDMSVGVIAFLLVGFGIAFGTTEWLDGWFGWGGLGVEGIDGASGADLWPATSFFFQAAFAATAATIVSGAMAERTKFKAYLIYSVVITALIYPVILRWTWGGGWLAQREFPFSDFAGSTVVHATGGWAAMMGAFLLGPRIGKYGPDGKPRAIPGHSIPFVVIGAFILFIGWFGFNPGSELAADEFVMMVAVRTLVAGCAGAVVAMSVSWLKGGKPDVSMTANGLLAGLVAITAPCGAVQTWAAVVIGAIAGALVVASVAFFDRIRIDDPVGALSVHLVCGAFGTLAVGLFAQDHFTPNTTGNGLFYGGGLGLLGAQLVGILAVGVFVALMSALAWSLLKAVVGIRVPAEEEHAGLDIGEHGISAYPEFRVSGAGTASAAMDVSTPRVGTPAVERAR
jgi:Amt family ammonium transporter